MENRSKRTMQRFGTSVSVAAEGEQAGPQASFSSDRSSSTVGNLAVVESNVTSQISSEAENVGHVCTKDKNIFCFICAQLPTGRNRRDITEHIKKIYKHCFKIEMLDTDKDWAPKFICNPCFSMVDRHYKDGIKYHLKLSTPSRWSKPRTRAVYIVTLMS